IVANEDLAICENPDDVFPIYFKPDEKVSVAKIHEVCSDAYEGTKWDLSKTADAGRYGNILLSSGEYEYRPTNVSQCTYFQCSNVKAWLPEEARCLVYFGFGAPSTTYLTPVFASARHLVDSFGRGRRAEYDPESGWWNEAFLQQVATINYADAIEQIKAVRDPLMNDQYETTFAVQNQATKMIKNGMREEAIDLLTTYADQQANMWFDLYKDLQVQLLARYATNRVLFKNAPTPDADWWTAVKTAVHEVNDSIAK
ncbi:MAG: C69 family dipeptidase, partial [Spirochaetales bacterium]|nr:C69 family dipeptidase [Spirochaetales bacterium]